MNLSYYQNLMEKHQKEFETYFEELVSYNEKVNLTNIVEKYDVFTKHFLDSLLPIAEIPENASVVDVGTGAGFPGLPLKIVREDIELTLVDSLNKRISFLNMICDKLKIKSNNIHSRAEDFAKTNRENFDVATARAVAKLNTLLEYLMPLVKIGGYVVAYKGNNYSEELEDAKKAIEILGGEFVKTVPFSLPNETGERNIIIIKKIKPTPIEYPRGRNLPKSNPIL